MCHSRVNLIINLLTLNILWEFISANNANNETVNFVKELNQSGGFWIFGPSKVEFIYF